MGQTELALPPRAGSATLEVRSRDRRRRNFAESSSDAKSVSQRPTSRRKNFEAAVSENGGGQGFNTAIPVSETLVSLSNDKTVSQDSSSSTEGEGQGTEPPCNVAIGPEERCLPCACIAIAGRIPDRELTRRDRALHSCCSGCKNQNPMSLQEKKQTAVRGMLNNDRKNKPLCAECKNIVHRN